MGGVANTNVSMDKAKKRYALGRTNGGGKNNGGNGTLSFHVNAYFGCVTASKYVNREQWIVELKDNDNMNNLVYHEHPTKEQLLEYFSQRIRVRKMTPREAFRLMDVDDADIDKMMNAEETVTLKNGTAKKRKAISKTACYKLAGNSIVVSCLYHLFRTMFIPNQPENKIKQSIQPSLFD